MYVFIHTYISMYLHILIQYLLYNIIITFSKVFKGKRFEQFMDWQIFKQFINIIITYSNVIVILHILI